MTLSRSKMATMVTAAVAATLVTAPAGAEPKSSVVPPLGTEHTATVGSPILEQARYDALRIATTKVPIAKRVLLMIRLEAGEPLYPTYSATAKFKGCAHFGPCAFDDDGDGIFDRMAKDDTSTAFKLNEPVPYEIKETPNPDAPYFRQTISYLGATSDTLRLSYREFVNGTARPAFTEEMTLPLGKSFPQTVAFKDVKLTILAIDGMGLRYRVEK